MENFKFREAVKWGLKFLHQTTKRHILNAKIWSNKSFGVCGTDVVLILYAGEKKVRENRHWKLDVVYNTTSLPRRRDMH